MPIDPKWKEEFMPPTNEMSDAELLIQLFKLFLAIVIGAAVILILWHINNNLDTQIQQNAQIIQALNKGH